MAIADSSRVEPHDLGAEAAPDQIRLDRDPRCRSKQNARAPDPPHSIRRLSIAAPALKSSGAHDSIVHTFVLVNLFTSPDLNPQPVPERSKRARGVRVVRARWIVSLVDMKFDRAFARCVEVKDRAAGSVSLPPVKSRNTKDHRPHSSVSPSRRYSCPSSDNAA